MLHFLVLWGERINLEKILIGQLVTCDPGTEEKGAHGGQALRSEERRVGKEWLRPRKSLWSSFPVGHDTSS